MATREPQRVFYLFCEGTNTEPGYFKALKQAVRHADIELQLFDSAGAPMTLAQAASAHLRSIKRKAKKESFAKADEVWAVFDRDDHQSYFDAINHCNQTGVGIANSNPCFEVWLILHIEDFQSPVGRAEVTKKLREIRPDYDPVKKTMNFSDLMDKIANAEGLAIKQLENRKKEASGKDLGRPYTMVFALTRSIRSAAEKFSGKNVVSF